MNHEFPCIYREEVSHRHVIDKPCDGGRTHPVFWCDVFAAECTSLATRRKAQGGGKMLHCFACDNREEEVPQGPPVIVPLDPPSPPEGPVEDFLTTADGRDGGCLSNQYQGRSVFLAGGGPSLNDQDLSPLNQRGIITAAMNQVGATHLRPNIWFCVDGPNKFSSRIWLDPAVMKITRAVNRGCHLSRPAATDTGWELDPDLVASHCPNTWFYQESKGFNPEDFFTRSRPTWSGEFTLDNGRIRETRSVFLTALRILHWLGFGRVFLIGADFRMHPSRAYAFDIPRPAGTCGSNNTTYGVMRHWMRDLQQVSGKYRIQFINCTPGSELDAFPRMELADAVETVLAEEYTPIKRVRGLYGDKQE